MKFAHLRETDWSPTFDWVKTAEEAADQINSFHEDYPKYVKMTAAVLPEVANHACQIIEGDFLKRVHELVFADQPWAGRWRTVDVIVGQHRPPQRLLVADLMQELEHAYDIQDMATLLEWYKDFETIHPFQDGNGRVGGIIVAAWSTNLEPLKGWLTANQ